ncbi:hypothetical protein FACS1894187_04400 [Synergistales bacterium]|nr:hypothetical protein FACS1894187_04400 [Synergistales bacterium]
MRIFQRLDTGMFYIVKENGDKVENANGIIYFEDILAADRLVAHTKRHNTAFELRMEDAKP